MEEIFLNFISAINDSRYWLGPLLAICIYIILAWQIITTVQDDIEEPIFHHRPRSVAVITGDLRTAPAGEPAVGESPVFTHALAAICRDRREHGGRA